MSQKVKDYRQIEDKSWVVSLKQGRMVVEPSTWAPGYTPGHHETKAGAIMHAMDRAIEEDQKIKGHIEQLADMLNEEMG